jgi:hypothetical protein
VNKGNNTEVKEMKRMLVVLMIVGFLMLGTVTVITEESEGNSEDMDFENEDFGGSPGNPAPCGGGNGGGGGQPG